MAAKAGDKQGSNNSKDKNDNAREDWPRLELMPQQMEDIMDLDTGTDQIGSINVEHVFKRVRDVYGQPPRDIKKVNWKEYGIPEFQGRPSPFDFPAFEHERDLTVLATMVDGDRKGSEGKNSREGKKGSEGKKSIEGKKGSEGKKSLDGASKSRLAAQEVTPPSHSAGKDAKRRSRGVRVSKREPNRVEDITNSLMQN